jgi:predicted outer membrane protein
MQAEHKAMQGMADKLATRLNLTPGTPDLAKQKTDMANQMAQQLDQNAKGTAYDRQYIDGQVLAHQQTLEQLRAMQNAQNAELKTLVVSAIPKVEMHLQRAQKIQQQLGGTGGMGSSGSSTSGAGNNVGNTSGAMNSGGTTP